VRTGSRGGGENLSCEQIIVVEVGDGEVVVQTALTPPFDVCRVVGPSSFPRQFDFEKWAVFGSSSWAAWPELE
jgi:hypothetical protein